MIIGSGLLAQAFTPTYSHREDVCIYAAGVSNSACTNIQEFAREQQRLSTALQKAQHVDSFLYFGTCSAGDPEAQNTAYIQHKIAMERLVSNHPQHLILRLPQVAGTTPNPHTLLNYLYAKITRSEAFNLWKNATRNIIDIADIASITNQLIDQRMTRNTTLNIANPTSYTTQEIVNAMERVIGKRGVYAVIERGSEYSIDISPTLALLKKLSLNFDESYLERVIKKYYGK
jgi:nucleoside-diphosphate-sugar epimerase